MLAGAAWERAAVLCRRMRHGVVNASALSGPMGGDRLSFSIDEGRDHSQRMVDGVYMLVCLDHNVTDSPIRQAVREPAFPACAQCAWQVMAAVFERQGAAETNRPCMPQVVVA